MHPVEHRHRREADRHPDDAGHAEEQAPVPNISASTAGRSLLPMPANDAPTAPANDTGRTASGTSATGTDHSCASSGKYSSSASSPPSTATASTAVRTAALAAASDRPARSVAR